MKINIQGTNLELTEKLKNYFYDKIDSAISAFGSTDLSSVIIDLEIERTTNHHQKADDLYRAEANVSVPGDMLRADDSGETPEAAIDLMRDVLEREIRKWHKRQIDNARRGARAAKDILRTSIDEE